MNMIQVWPAPGTICRDEETGAPIQDGEQLERTPFVLRRIADQSLLTTAPEKPVVQKSQNSADPALQPSPEKHTATKSGGRK